MCRFFSKVNHISNVSMLNTVPKWNDTCRTLDVKEERHQKTQYKKEFSLKFIYIYI